MLYRKDKGEIENGIGIITNIGGKKVILYTSLNDSP